jgi:hypothetical protein
MELFSAEVTKIKGLIDDWRSHPEIELEATFGLKGIVDMQTFLRVVQRLQSRGFGGISQEDRLTVSLSNSLRFTLSGANQVALYCRDNIMAGKPFVVMSKSKVQSQMNESSNVDLEDYDVRVKMRRETGLNEDNISVQQALAKWSQQRKFFRLIRRWTFKCPGVKFDLSMVRSTQVGKDGYAYQRNFQDQPLISAQPTFEIEVELDRHSFGESPTTDEVFAALVRGIGEVLRGIQGCPVLIRKKVKEDVLKDYKELVGTPRFRGVAPVTLQVENMTKVIDPDIPNIRDNYNVTDKADGLRVHGFTNEKGELFMIDMAMNVYRTGYVKASCRNALLDGEYITKDKHGKSLQEFLVFDIYIAAEKQDITKLPFYVAGEAKTRYDKMKGWMADWNEGDGPTKTVKTNSLKVAMKTFFFPTDIRTIFQCAADMLNQRGLYSYHQDGLIFTPNALPLPEGPGVGFEEQFKWKPSEENTIDFLIEFERDPQNTVNHKITTGIHPDTGATVRYKTLRLFVGSREDPAYMNPRRTILFEEPLPGTMIGGPDKRSQLKAVLFEPKEFPENTSSVCYLETERDPKTNEEYVAAESEPIRDRSIIEMRYDAKRSPGWRWVPIRIRLDKTERLLKGRLERTLNSIKTAESIWNSIHDPVTTHMIRSGDETPSPQEMAAFVAKETVGAKEGVKRYYERNITAEDKMKVLALRMYHNKYIKDQLLYKAIGHFGSGKSMIDFAVGRANDLHRWRRAGLSFVLGVDATGACCLDHEDGAYKRLLDTIVQARKYKHKGSNIPIPRMFFIVADSSMRLEDGTAAGENEEEANMLRSILGRVEPTGPVPPAVGKHGDGKLAAGADTAVCMYALHYFFENSEKLNGFLQNIADNLKVGGVFVGTNFDGQAVYDMLRPVPKGQTHSGLDDGKILWEITKLYDDNGYLPQDDTALGMAIDVKFISIGATHREYLVPWDLFVAKMKTIGCELLSREELDDLGFENSTNMYKASYAMAIKGEDGKKKYTMNEASQAYSFLNRWYIFKRTSQGTGEIGKIVGEVEAAGTERPATAAATAAVAAAADAEALALSQAAADASATAATAAEALMGSIAPGGAAAAAAMSARIAEAQARGDRIELRRLNQEAFERASAAAIARGEAPPVQQLAVGEPAGAYATREVAAAIAAAGPADATVPVEERTLVAAANDKKKYFAKDVFQFFEESDKTAKDFKELPAFSARYLAPNARFPIKDTSDPEDTTVYPSITHFLAAMKFKYASAVPEMAQTFSRTGSIHQEFLGQRERVRIQKSKLTPEEDHSINLLESTRVKTVADTELAKKDTGFDNSKWLTRENEILRSAVLQRLTADKKFCEIISIALGKGKYLLYTTNTSSDLGGERLINRTIRGANKYGKMIMTLAAELPDTLKACLARP